MLGAAQKNGLRDGAVDSKREMGKAGGGEGRGAARERLGQRQVGYGRQGRLSEKWREATGAEVIKAPHLSVRRAA